MSFALHYTDLGRDLDDGEYPLFALAAHEGVQGLLQYAREVAGFTPDPAGSR